MNQLHRRTGMKLSAYFPVCQELEFTKMLFSLSKDAARRSNLLKIQAFS
jgi:hypothetical protein